eukprot:scaffold77929_cov33-Tisochrysis_lutea.AAC.1
MKFGRLLQAELADTGWPHVRYKLLKHSIKRRVMEHEVASIFHTGTFKKMLREDMQLINNCWLKMERDLFERRQAAVNVPYLAQQYEDLVHECLRWLALNYLAVLKIAKKHDKHCRTQLHGALAKVLLMQPFVIGMRASPIFHGSDLIGGGQRTPSSVTSSKLDTLIAACSEDAVSVVIAQLLGSAAAHYFPQPLQQYLETIDDSCESVSDQEFDLEAESSPLPVRRVASRRGRHVPARAAEASEARRLSAMAECEENWAPGRVECAQRPCEKELSPGTSAADSSRWMMLAYLFLVG